MRLLAGAAALFVLGAPAALSAAACACAPCPLVLPGPCAAERPCCGEPESQESCDCAHLDAPDALPTGPDVSIPSSTAFGEAAAQAPDTWVAVAEVVAPSGPDPPLPQSRLFLTLRVLRL